MLSNTVACTDSIHGSRLIAHRYDADNCPAGSRTCSMRIAYMMQKTGRITVACSSIPLDMLDTQSS